ncbi:MAG: D-2-hydroxyacid dehydrogenase [Chloroflexota bacterium]
MKENVEVLVTLQLDDELVERIRKVCDNVNLTVLPVKDAAEVPLEQWEKTEVLFTSSRVLPELSHVPLLKWIQFNYAGVDRVILKPIIQDSDVIATSSSGVITSQVAEYVMMTLLAFGQQLPQMMALQAEKTWPDNVWKTLMPLELRGSTVGILGYGSIGRQVARLLQPFGVSILAAKKDAMHPEDSGYTQEGMGDPHGDFFQRLYPIEALHSMLKECDFVIIALPLTAETYHLMGAAEFEVMKPGAYLVNIGRGDIINEEALVAALSEGKLAGAALDVFHEEPLPESSPLWTLPNVIITPHVSGLSLNLMSDIVDLFIENLKHYIADQPLYNRIDPQKGY